jgi:7-cyano-7-deazaguanine synthase
MNSARAICLLSGGPDSVIAALLAREAGHEMYGLYVDYGQRTSKREQRQAELTAEWLGIREFEVAAVPFLGQLGGSGITDTRYRVTSSEPDSEYVPFRNTILVSMAVAWAEVLPAATVVIGSIGGPWITPDNKPAYFAALNTLVAEGSRHAINVWAPLGAMSKQEVIAAGLARGVPFELTWSCQNDSAKPCAECNNCRDRERAFRATHAEDPLFTGNQL